MPIERIDVEQSEPIHLGGRLGVRRDALLHAHLWWRMTEDDLSYLDLLALRALLISPLLAWALLFYVLL